MSSCCAICASAWADALAKSSISAFCRSLSCAQAAKRKKVASTIAARFRISVLVRLQGLAPATWQTWAYCSPAQAIKATAIMAAMKSKLSPRPINGISATFVARVKLVLLSVSIRTSPDWFVPTTVARHKGKSWLTKDKRRTRAHPPPPAYFQRSKSSLWYFRMCGVSAAPL